MSNRKLREGLMLNFNNEPGTFLAQKSGGAIQQSASFLKKLLVVTLFCALSFMLSAPSLVQAQDLQQGTPAEQPSTNVQPVNTADPAELIASAVTENKPAAKANTQAADGLELGPEIIGQPVRAGDVPKPTINKVSIGDKKVSGRGLVGSGQRRASGKVCEIHVTVTDESGVVKETQTFSIEPNKSGTTWSVNLTNPLQEGYKVSAKQEFNGNVSEEASATVSPSLAKTYESKLKMPTGEIWIEQAGAANIVNAEEQAEALRLVKKANLDIAKDIKSVELKISGTSEPKTAKINVTYTDDTTSGEIEAPGLIVKQVTETSRTANISEITVVDNVIKGKLKGDGPFENIKVQIYTKIAPGDVANFNTDKGCKADKNSSKPVEVSVDSTTGKFTYPIPGAVGLPRDQVVGVSVKEKNKFVSCETSTVILATPEKTEVRDPKKLTDADKKAIDAAIRKANTINGTSKLPDGTGFVNDPAFIEFDKDGNVTIISPNDVDVTWNKGNPEYQKNADGTYRLKSGKENNVIKFPAKDLVKNLKPDSPQIAVNTDDGKVTITPPPYENAGEDTDLLSYTISYKDAKGNEKTATATRDLGTDKWSGPGVDEETGMITLSVEEIEVGGTIKATAKDNGGLEGDTDKLDSKEKTQTLETVTVSYDPNGGTGDMDSKKLNKGSEYKILENKFTAPENEKFKTWQIGTAEHKAGDKIRVKEDTTIQAIWQDIEVKVTYNANGGSGDMAGKTLKKGSKYTLLESSFKAPDENHEFKAWKVDGKEVPAGTEITVDKDTEVKAVWKKIQVKVTYDANGGSGTMNGKTVDKGSEYMVLPNAFKAPDGTQEFKTWEVDGQEVAPGVKITVKDNTVVKAVWKKIQVKVTYDANGGSGDMDGATVDKGSKYTLLESTFKAPDENQEFKAWEVDGKEVPAGTEITVTKDTKVKAVWKDKPVPPATTPGKDKPGKQGKSQPQNPAAGGNLSKTGANGMYSLYASLLLLATGGLFLISRRRRNQR